MNSEFNNYMHEITYINNFNELKNLINKYNDLQDKYQNAFIIDKLKIKEEINKIKRLLTYGIKIDNKIIDSCKLPIIELSNKLGIDSKQFEEDFDKIYLTISPVKLLSKGVLCNYGRYISIDYTCAIFDLNGQFIGLKEPKENYYKHVFTHELLHSISRNGFIIYQDSFSEGMTDYFAHKISKATNVFSDKYGYCERVFYLFGMMMGDDLLFEDYVTNLSTMPNLYKFMNSLGINDEEFKKFKKIMDIMLEEKFKEPIDLKKVKDLEEKSNNFIFNNIIMPYYDFDQYKSSKMMEKVFLDNEETKNDLCEIHYSNNLISKIV